MYTVYILKDSKNNLYKELTNNLKRRLTEHKRGSTKTTKNMKGIEVVYQEEYNNFDEARQREIYLKTAAGRKFIKKLLN